MSDDKKVEEHIEDKKLVDVADKPVNDLQPIIAGIKAKGLSAMAKVHEVIADKAPVVKDALVKGLDKLAEHSSEAKIIEAEKAKAAEAEAETLKAKADAQKAEAASSAEQTKPKDDKPSGPPSEKEAETDKGDKKEA